MKRIENAQVGDKVGYNNVSLMNYRGEIAEIKKTANGGDCIVKWFTGGGNLDVFVKSEECLFNLRRI